MAGRVVVYAFAVHVMPDDEGDPYPLLAPGNYTGRKVVVKLTRFESPDDYRRHIITVLLAVREPLLSVDLYLPIGIGVKLALSGVNFVMRWACRSTSRVTVRLDETMDDHDPDLRTMGSLLPPPDRLYTTLEALVANREERLEASHRLFVEVSLVHLASRHGDRIPDTLADRFMRQFAADLSGFIDWSRVSEVVSTMPLFYHGKRMPRLAAVGLRLSGRVDEVRSVAQCEALYEVFNAQLQASVAPWQLSMLSVDGPRRTLRTVYPLPAILMSDVGMVDLSDVSVEVAPGMPRNCMIDTLCIRATAVPTSRTPFHTSVLADLSGFGEVRKLCLGYNATVWAWPHAAVRCLVHLDSLAVGLYTDGLLWRRRRHRVRSRDLRTTRDTLAQEAFTDILAANPSMTVPPEAWRTAPLQSVSRMLEQPAVRRRSAEQAPADARYDKNLAGLLEANQAIYDTSVDVEPIRLPVSPPFVLGCYLDEDESGTAALLWQNVFGRDYEPLVTIVDGEYVWHTEAGGADLPEDVSFILRRVTGDYSHALAGDLDRYLDECFAHKNATAD